ncbi:MAG: N-formylglutamate amidohydrolase [Nanoarchaeota archaeon]|nr:N-formylglutamate amidohydrolase [Nanoarchaeota archaeon]
MEFINLITQETIGLKEEEFVTIKYYDKLSLILSIPHSSTLVDRRCLEFRNFTKSILLDTDIHTSMVYALEIGTTIQGVCNPYMVNYSRNRQSINDKRGVMPWEFLDSTTILKQEYSQELQEELLNSYYDKYHLELEKEILKKIEKNGFALLIDCHSMAKVPIKNCVATSQEIRPEICIGTLEGKSTELEIVQKLQSFFQKNGYETTIDKPYKGGYITQKYSSIKNTHVIQIEISKELYCFNSLQENFKIKSYETNKLQKTLREGFLQFYKLLEKKY